MDELALTGASLKHPADGGDVVDNAFGWNFSRLLTPTLSLGVSGGYIHRNWGDLRRSGFDQTSLMLKTLLFQNDPHEVMISAGLSGTIGKSGARGIGSDQFGSLEPGLFLGKGFGDAPNALAWLRPLAVTGAVSTEIPTTARSVVLGLDEAGQLAPIPFQTGTIVHWGFSIQYSTFYLTPRFSAGRLPKEEPLNQFIPLVEFAFNSPLGKKPVATINPGLVYVADKYQIGIEAIVPLNSEAGRATGVRAQLFLFTDELFPSLFGKPLLSR